MTTAMQGLTGNKGQTLQEIADLMGTVTLWISKIQTYPSEVQHENDFKYRA